jgi:hypothetical protein
MGDATIKQPSVFLLALACLLLPCLSHWQDLAKSEATWPTILVDSMMVSDFAELGRKVKSLDDASCNGGSRHLERPTTVGDFVGRKVKSIRVVHYASRESPPTAEEVRKSLRMVWQGKFQVAFCQVAWAEPAFWSIESIVEFEDGKRSAVITDGVHVALQDHDGKSWFFRLFPAAQ